MKRHGAAESRRAALLDWIHDQLRSGALAPGDPVPSLRELGEQFDLSRNSVQATLAELIDRGVLIAVARSGISVAEQVPPPHGACFVLAVRPDHLGYAKSHLPAVQRGFESQISRRGGYTWLWLVGDPPVRDAEVAGVFRFRSLNTAPVTDVVADPDVAVVDYGDSKSGTGDDAVLLANQEGGRAAAEHLLERGFRRIAFLARHVGVEADPDHWATEREIGWREAVTAAGQQPVVYRPLASDLAGVARREADQAAIAIAARKAVAAHHDFDACVAVDDWSIASFLEQWEQAGLPPDGVPALVGFEDLPEARGRFVTSFRPPWEDLGRAAADLLWQRAVGQVTGPPVRRSLSMDLAVRRSTHPSPGLRAPLL